MTDRVQVRLFDRTTPPHIVTLVLLAGISALSMNIFLPSLPGMTEYFQTDYTTIQLSVALYLLGNAGLQVIVGPISDKYGRRPVLLWSIGVFLIATAGCIFAPTVEAFLAFRMLQAIVATAMVLSRAVVRDMVPQNEAASMIGYVTMGMAVVPMIGPAIGGVLDQWLGWQASFALLLFCGIGVFFLTLTDLGETTKPRDISLVGQFREYPELLKAPRFWGYALTAAFASGAFFAFLGGAPYVATNVYGLQPSELGLYFGLTAFGYMFGNFLSGRYSVLHGINRMIVWGTIVTGGGLACILVTEAFGAAHPLWFFGFMTFMGLGNGMVMPNATAGLLSVRPHLAGTASGLGGAIMIGGGAGLSVLAGYLLTKGHGAFPLTALMTATSLCAFVTIRLVIRRERRMAGN